jgi:hypothetical protein
MKTALNDILRVSAQFFGLVPLGADVGAPAGGAEPNAAPAIAAMQ